MNKRVRWRSGGMAALREVRHAVAEMLDVPVQQVADGRCVDVELDDDLVMDVALIFEYALLIRFTDSELRQFACIRDIITCLDHRTAHQRSLEAPAGSSAELEV